MKSTGAKHCPFYAVERMALPTNIITMVVPFAPTTAWYLCGSSRSDVGNLFRRDWLRAITRGLIQIVKITE